MKRAIRGEERLEALKDLLGYETSFDVQVREFKLGNRDAALVYIDGLIKDVVTSRVLRSLLACTVEEVLPNTVRKLISSKIDHSELHTTTTVDEAASEVLKGTVALLVDRDEEIVILDLREYPVREPQEPDIERVSRGSRDGFVETLVFNTALIRRRLRDPSLRFEAMEVGRRSKTDVVVAYVSDIANPGLVSLIKDRIHGIDVDGIPMAEKTMEEFIAGSETWWNPFPTVRYTERPDVAATHLLEGHVVVLVDTSPSALIAPSTAFHHLQHAEEYRQDIGTGMYTRLVRLFGVLLSFLLPPLWLGLALIPELPEPLQIIGPREEPTVSLFAQFVTAEIGIDLIRMASIHVPSPLATALGLIGAILLGEFAVSVGLFVPETILYMAIAAIGMFATPSLEFSQAVKLFRLMTLILVGALGLLGVAVGTIITFVLLARTRSFGVPYLWPLVPLDMGALPAALLRLPLPLRKWRPSVLKPLDREASGETPPS